MGPNLKKLLDDPIPMLSPFICAHNGDLLSNGKYSTEYEECDCAELGLSCDTSACVNFASNIQCSDKCGAKQSCKNNWVKHLDSQAHLEGFLSGNKNIGVGIKSKKCIPEGTVVGEYVGQLISNTEFDERMEDGYKKNKHFYCMYLDHHGHANKRAIIDATEFGNLTRFINHCKVIPNLKAEIWYYKGFPRMVFKAKFDLPKGIELTYNYKSSDFNPKVCLCSNCKPNKNAKQFIPPVVVEKSSKNSKKEEKRKGFKEKSKYLGTRNSHSKLLNSEGQPPPSADCPSSPVVPKSHLPSTSSSFVHQEKSPQIISAAADLIMDHQSSILPRRDKEYENHSLSMPISSTSTESELVPFPATIPSFSASSVQPHPTSDKCNFICNLCKKSYSGKYELVRHVRMKHQKLKPFQCQCCESSFPERHLLIRHIQTKHKKSPEAWEKLAAESSRKKIFTCNVCQRKNFSHKNCLKRHIRKFHSSRDSNVIDKTNYELIQ